MKNRLPLSGVILAGGKNRRMGGFHKALLGTPGGATFISWQIQVMLRICREILVVTDVPDLLKSSAEPYLEQIRIRFISDLHRDKGPIGGLQSALHAANHTFVWLVGCDSPFLSDAACRLMLDKAQRYNGDAVIPVVQNRPQMLHGVYQRRCRNQVDELMAQNRLRLSLLLKMIRWMPLDEGYFQLSGIDPRFSVDIDSPEEYESCFSEDHDAYQFGC